MAAGAIFGQLIGKAMDWISEGPMEDERNRRQQQHIRNMTRDSNKAEKGMAEYYYGLSKRRFEELGAGAQADQLRRHGLNVGLMYGGAGAGGQSTGPVQKADGNAKGDNVQSNTSGMAMQLGAQASLMDAQTKNIEADTELKKVEADKKAGVDTQKTQTEIDSLTQGINNAKAQEEMTKAQQALTELQTMKEAETFDAYVKRATAEAKTAVHSAEIAGVEEKVQKATAEDQIKTVKQIAIGSVIENALKNAQINKTQAEIKSITENIWISWENANTNKQNANVNAANAFTNAEQQILNKKLGEAGLDNKTIDQVIGVVGAILGLKR